MRSISTSIFAAAIALGGLVAVAPAASADERVCRGAIGAITLDDVRVPQGASCWLTSTNVKGNVKVERGATLTVNKARINGNIQSQAHRLVRVFDARVGGSIQLVQGGGSDTRRNIVNGDIQLFSNTYGTKVLRYNRVGGNLQCKGNTPAPTGIGNRVGGNKEDQCRRL